MPATGRRLSFRARPLRAGAAPRVARAPCRAVDTPLICASQMRALRLPLGTWQRARRWLATDPTQTCWAGGGPRCAAEERGRHACQRGDGVAHHLGVPLPRRGALGDGFWRPRTPRGEPRRRGAGDGAGPDSAVLRAKRRGERREKEKERDGGTEHEAAWRRPGARGPGFLLERHFPGHPCQLPRQNQSRVQSVHSPRLHGQTINAPQSRPPQLSLSRR